MTTDTFRADENGRIVEHWDVIDYYRTPENDQLDQILEILKSRIWTRKQKIKSWFAVS